MDSKCQTWCSTFIPSFQSYLVVWYLLSAYLVCLVHQILWRMKIQAWLLVAVVNVWPGLQVRNVQSITEGLNMRTKDEVMRSKQCLNTIANLLTNLNITSSQNWCRMISNYSYLVCCSKRIFFWHILYII